MNPSSESPTALAKNANRFGWLSVIGLLAGGALLSVVGAATWVFDPVQWEASAIVRLEPSDCTNLLTIVSQPLNKPTYLSTRHVNLWVKRWWNLVREVVALNEPQGTEMPARDAQGDWPAYAKCVTFHQRVKIWAGEARELINVAVISDTPTDAVIWANFMSARLVSDAERWARKRFEDWILAIQYHHREISRYASNQPAIPGTNQLPSANLSVHTNRWVPFDRRAHIAKIEKGLQELPATYRILRPAAEPATPVHLQRPLALKLLAIGFVLSGLGLVLAGFFIAPRMRHS